MLYAGRAGEAATWLEIALRFDGANAHTAQLLCQAYYFLGRYGEAIEPCDRALTRNPGRSIQMMTRPVLAATYAQLNRPQDAERERAAVMRLSPFIDAERFAGQFGTQEAHDHMLEGLKKAGFH